MAEDIKFVVVGHHSRIEYAQRLSARLNAHLLIDDGDHGANWNHRRALEWAACQPCRVVVNRNEFAKLYGSALVTEDGEAIEGDALDEVEVFGVLTHSLNRVGSDDCPVM